jgi:hypothetical protein
MVRDSCVAVRLLAMMAGFLVAASGGAQDRPVPQDGEPSPGIVVQGRSVDQLHHLVETLTSTEHDSQIGRWTRQVCLNVEGLEPPDAQYLQSRIEAEAERLKVPFSRNGKCSPNVWVAVTTNADELARRISETEPWLITDPAYGDPTKAQTAALAKPQPVRWYVANRRVSGSSGMTSRITPPTREETAFAYILVDATKLTHITWGQLGDYIAFDVFAGPNPRMDPPADSILSIFAERDAGHRGPLALTTQDVQFLDALYMSNPELALGQQRRDIERLMAKANHTPNGDPHGS